MSELWLPVPGYEGAYEVSTLGRVRSLKRITDRGRNWPGRMMTPAQMRNGYWTVTLWRDGKQKSALVHRLVLTTFVGPCPEGMEALHKTGNSSDNALSNLRWGTHAENVQDQLAHGTHPHASKEACPAGHPYDEANTYVYPGDRAHRACRVCRKENLRRWHAENPTGKKKAA